MAVTNITLAYPSGANQFQDTNNANAAVAVKASAATLYFIDIDNTLNGAASYVKLFNVGTGSITVGTTAPDEVHFVAASTRLVKNIPQGQSWGTALSVCTVTTGGTAGSTSPSSAVTVRLVYA